MRLAILLLALVAGPASAQFAPAGSRAAGPRAADLVTWRVAAAPAARGGTASVTLRATIAPGWRMYAMDSPVGRPLAVDVDALPRGLATRAPRQSATRRAFDEAFQQHYPYFAGSAEVTVPVAVARGAARGRHAVAGSVRYALCDDRVCLPPATTPFRATLTVR